MKVININQVADEEVSHNSKVAKKAMLKFGEVAHLMQFAQATFPPGEKAPEHYHHDMTEIFFVVSGQGKITIEQEEFILEPGVCATVQPHEMHEIENTGQENLVLSYFGVIV